MKLKLLQFLSHEKDKKKNSKYFLIISLERPSPDGVSGDWKNLKPFRGVASSASGSDNTRASSEKHLAFKCQESLILQRAEGGQGVSSPPPPH